MEALGGRLIIERKHADDIKMRDLYVRIDDLPQENVLFNDTLEIALPPGRHRIKVTNRLYSKMDEFDLGEGETVRFSAANIPTGGVFAFMMVLGGTPPYKVVLERVA